MRDKVLALAVWSSRRAPWLVLAIALAVTAACGRIGLDPELRSSQLDMIPKDNPVVKHWIDFTNDFDILADLFVVVKGQDLDEAKQFARELERELGAIPKLVKSTEYRLDPKLYEHQGLYFLPLADVRSMENRVAAQREDLHLLAREPGFLGLAKVFQYELEREVEADPKDVLDFFRFIRDTSLRLEAAAAGRADADMPWKSFFGMSEAGNGSADPFADDGWKLSVRKDGLLIAIHPADSTDDFDFIVPFFEQCRATVDKLKAQHPALEVGLTGQPASIYYQRDVVHGDLERTSLVSLVLVSLVWFWGFRGIGLPMLALVSLVSAIVWSFGVLHFAPGHLNLITTAFVSMLLGLGEDYGVYIVSQFSERRRAGTSTPEAIRGSILAAGPGIITGGLTCSAGFFTLMLTDFTGFQELGLIAGYGILLCMFSMLFMLPALLAVAGRFFGNLGTGRTGRTERLLEWITRQSLRNSTIVLVVFAAGSAVLLVEGFQTEFDYNLLNLEPENTEPAVYERVMQRDFEITPDTVMVTTATLAEAVAKKKRLEGLPTVGNVDSLGNYVPEDPAEKRKILRRVGKEVGKTSFRKPAPLDLPALAEVLDGVRRKLKELRLGLMMLYGGEHVVAASEAIESLSRVVGAARGPDKAEVGRRLGRYQEASFADLSSGFEDFKKMLAAEPFALERLPEPIRARYRGKSGRYVLFVSPKVDVRQEKSAKLFIEQAATVAPDATGVPILIDEVMSLLRRGFQQATAYSLLAVIMLVFLDFRSPRDTALALTPLVVSLAATLGLMSLTGTKFNPANFVSIPILTGLGMAYGVYLLHRVKQEPESDSIAAVRSTGRSILMSCLTSLAGFGSLMLAQNRGLHSLGLILFGGLTIALIASLVMLPTLIEVVGYRLRRPHGHEKTVREAILDFRF